MIVVLISSLHLVFSTFAVFDYGDVVLRFECAQGCTCGAVMMP